MRAKEQGTFTESGLVCELLESERSFQTYAARLLYQNIRIWAKFFESSSAFEKNVAPEPALREQFERSVDAVEEMIANIARLRIKSQRVSDFDKRWGAIGPKRRQHVIRLCESILRGFGIEGIEEHDTPLTPAQRRQLKALLRKGLEGLPAGQDPDKAFVLEILSKRAASR